MCELTMLSMIVALVGGLIPTAETPFGFQLQQSEVASLQGIWRTDAGQYVRLVHCDGLLYYPNQVFNTSLNEFEVRTVEVHLRKFENRYFIFLRGKKENDDYLFFLLEYDGTDSLSLRTPDWAAFNSRSDPVLNETLQPSTKDSDDACRITERSLRSALDNNALEQYFPLDSKVKLQRVAGLDKNGRDGEPSNGSNLFDE